VSTSHKQWIAGIFDRAAPTYGQVGVDYVEPLAAMLVEATGPRPGQDVLDVGCGRGASLFAAADAVGPTGTVTGIDLAPGMVAATSAAIAGRGLANATVRIGDAEAPDFPAGSFDAIIAGLVIFFLPDPDAAAAAYARLLRPGGRIGLTSFCEPSEAEKAMRQTRSEIITRYVEVETPAPGPAPAQQLLTAESMRGLLAGAGFTGIETKEIALPLRFDSHDQYWAFLWSAGFRQALERIPPDRLDQAREELTALIPPVEGGGYGYDSQVRITTATRE